MTDEGHESLAVDMVKCDGHGICAWLFPERVGLDDWGYAWVDPTEIRTSRQRRAARAAVRACPRRALSLIQSVTPTHSVVR
ncbi:MAG TPA: ferredoxin [Mycobacteriales bacterium]|nr:ferredoxin [Mycobacteriales bacterium]